MAGVGKHIRALRQQRGMTQDELAQKLYVSRQTVSNYETGRSNPDIDTLLKMAEALGADVNALLYGPPPPPEKALEGRRLVLQGFAALLLGALLLVFLPKLAEMHLRLSPGYELFLVIRVYLLPAFYVFLGWTLVQAIEFLYGVRRTKDTFAKARPFVAGLVLLYFVVCLPYVCAYIDGGIKLARALRARDPFADFQYSYTIAFIPWLDRLVQHVMLLYVYPYSPAFLLGGIALRITRKIKPGG